ncbi:hypothetical protein ACWIGW_44480 [Nocardia brasiliensis]
MPSYITDEQRVTARDQAVAAVRAHFAGDGERGAAQRAVTAALVVYDISHRQIAQLAGVSGLAIINLITPDYQYSQMPDNSDRRVLAARAEALKYERHAADRYRDDVLDAIRQEAVHRTDYLKESEVAVAATLGVNRASIRKWRAETDE